MSSALVLAPPVTLPDHLPSTREQALRGALGCIACANVRSTRRPEPTTGVTSPFDAGRQAWQRFRSSRRPSPPSWPRSAGGWPLLPITIARRGTLSTATPDHPSRHQKGLRRHLPGLPRKHPNALVSKPTNTIGCDIHNYGPGAQRATMSWFDTLYRAIADALFATPDTATEDELRAAAQHLAPVVWLVGKAGAGKSSIVAALTGHEQAKIGDGFAPCTRTAEVFDYPEEAPLIRFLDTRGLEEPGYDPAEDIAWCESQSHLILAVMRAADPSQQSILSVLRTARSRHPEWPIVVAQTGLHDLYLGGMPHPIPYSFVGERPTAVGGEAVRGLYQALLYQRDLLAGLPGAKPTFVPIDFTRADDGYTPPDYGSEALREALVAAGLKVFDEIERAKNSAFARRCWATILAYATLTAGGAAIPVPFVDVTTFTTASALMLRALAQRYGVEWTPVAFTQFFGAIGFGTLFWWGLRFGVVELLKLIPVLGTVTAGVINGSLAFGMTVGLGQAACVWLDYMRRGETPPDEAIRRAFAEGLRRRPPQANPGSKAA